MSLPYAAIGAGMLILPPLTQVLLSIYDWRVAHRVLGARRAAGAAAGDAAAARAHDGRLGRMALDACRRGRQRGGALDGSRPPCAPAPSGACLPPTSSRRSPPTACMPHSVAYLVERGFDPAGRGQRLRPGRHALGHRHHHRRLAVGPLRPPADGDPLLPLHHHRRRRPPARVAAGRRWLLVYAFVVFFGLMQGARGPIIVAMVATLFPGGVGAVYGTLSRGAGRRRRLRLLALGLALRADRQLHRLVPAGHRRRRWPGSPPSGWCAACARSASPPPRLHRSGPR